MKSLLNDVKPIPVAGAAAAAQTDVDGAVIDMTQDSGYAAVCGVAQLGDVTATCVLELTLRGSTAADGSNSVQLSTTGTFTAAASDADSKLLVLDHVQPMYRYVFHRLKRGTANAVVAGIVAYLHNPGATPGASSGVVKQAVGIG
ncbi:MAG TPA: hypothetical protein VD866_30315 [Urbifossiella sp.]|nr:hypothetical protein [Urbifossiella sp.]